MKQTFLHRPGLKIAADFSNENPPLFRYTLSATKEGCSATPKTVCAIMQNPSYACAEFADKSVQVLERVVFEKSFEAFHGIERLIIVNQFAFIQTNGFVGTKEQIGLKNDAAISQAIAQSEIILIAWGKDNRFLDRQSEILEIIRGHRGGPRKSDRLLRWNPDIKTKGSHRYDKKKKSQPDIQGKGCVGGLKRRKNVIRTILTIRGSCEPDQYLEEAIIEGFA